MGGEKPFESGTLVYPICDLERLHRERHFDAIVIGGGDLIRLDSGWASQEKYDVDASTMELWLIPAVVSLKYDIPLLWNSPGVPFPFTAAQTPLVKLALDAADYLSVRDETSRDNLGETEACRVAVSPDTVFTVDGLYPREKTDGLSSACARDSGLRIDLWYFKSISRWRRPMHALRRCRRFRRNTALRSFSCRSVTCTWIRSACVRCTALFPAGT